MTLSAAGAHLSGASTRQPLSISQKLRLAVMAIAAFLFSFSLPTAYSQAGGGSRGAFAISKDSVLSTGLQKEVIDFFTSHPKMAKEIFPFEQDCIAGDEREVKACEEAVRGQLEDFKDEITLSKEKAQLSTEKAQLSTEKAQLSTEKAQLKIHQEMIDNITIVIAVLGINNILRGVKESELGDTLADLKKVKNSQLKGDIDEIIKVGGILLAGEKISTEQASKAQSILLSRSSRALSIYQSLSPEEQKRFNSTYTMAVGAPKYAIRKSDIENSVSNYKQFVDSAPK